MFFVSSAELMYCKLSWAYRMVRVASVHPSIHPSIHPSVRPSGRGASCLSFKQARFVTMGGGGTWKSKQSDISPELSVGLSPYFYLKYRRLTQYVFHPSFLFDPPNYSDRQAANRFWISQETSHRSEDSRRTPGRMMSSSWRKDMPWTKIK
jgi:hypothetical protein